MTLLELFFILMNNNVVKMRFLQCLNMRISFENFSIFQINRWKLFVCVLHNTCGSVSFLWGCENRALTYNVKGFGVCSSFKMN